MLLDDGEECVCPQLISYSLLCKWFQTAVLPLDRELHAELLKNEDMRRCTVCGAAFNSSNKNLRTYKLLHVSDKKYNELNLFLLQQHFTTKALPLLLMELANHSTKKITTYKKLERQLKSFEIGGII